MPIIIESDSSGMLATPEELSEFEGAPFATTPVLSAGEAIRSTAGWHIAPSVTATFLVDGDGGHLLFLPTMRLTGVSEVRDVTDPDNPRTLTGWRKSIKGVLYRAAGWPCGFEVVEVDATHGYESCPPDLLPTVADYTRRRIAQESLGSRSVTFINDGASRVDAAVSRYTIPARP